MLRLCAAAMLAAVLGAGCSSDAEVVSMVAGREFSPVEIRIDAGTTVRFVNDSNDAHTVTAYEQRIPDTAEYFASGGAPSESLARADPAEGLLTEGESYELTFDEEGRYEYFCIPHEGEGMKGVLIVRRPEAREGP